MMQVIKEMQSSLLISQVPTSFAYDFVHSWSSHLYIVHELLKNIVAPNTILFVMIYNGWMNSAEWFFCLWYVSWGNSYLVASAHLNNQDDVFTRLVSDAGIW